jgi:hypothetical protein
MKRFALLLTATSARLALAIILGSPAFAADRLLVGTYEALLEIYDVNNGSSTARPSVALPRSITAMERSPGGAWLYIIDYFGEMHLVDTRSSTFFTTPGSAGAGSTDLAVHPNRSEVYINTGGTGVLIQDAAGWGVVGNMTLAANPTGAIDLVAVTHAGDRVYAWDQNSGDLREWDPVTGTVTTVWTVTYDIWQMGVSTDDSFVVLAGSDTWQAGQLGDPTDPVHVVVYNRQNGLVYGTIIPQGDIPLGLAFDTVNLSKFWVGCKPFVQPMVFTGTQVVPSPTTIGKPLPHDLATNDQGDLYVLYDDEIVLHPAGGAGQTVVAMQDDQLRLYLEVVPALAPPSGPSLRMRSRWAGLIEAVAVQRWQLPWAVRDEWTKCVECNTDQMVRDYEEALVYLAEVKQDRILDVAEVTAFLTRASDTDATAAALFLDELLIAREK